MLVKIKLQILINNSNQIFIRKNQINKSEPIFPLKCLLNPKTGMISNLIKTNDSERYNLYDYSYTSSNSLYAKNYWKSYFKDILAEVFELTKSYRKD